MSLRCVVWHECGVLAWRYGDLEDTGMIKRVTIENLYFFFRALKEEDFAIKIKLICDGNVSDIFKILDDKVRRFILGNCMHATLRRGLVE